MVQIFLGDDLARKDTQIAAHKASLFKNPQALNFDYDNLDASGLAADTLKKALMTLPAVAPKRLVVLRNAHKLKTNDVAVLENFFRNPLEHVDLILESSENALKGQLHKCMDLCQVNLYSVASVGNAFDMTRLMTAGRAKEALKMLNDLYGEDTHPLQVMGALVWYWGKEGRGFGPAKFERGLKALEEADLNIKRSRLKPEYAVEKLVVELMALRR